MTEVPARISASQVRLILERAAEIDARGDSLTVDELRQIAAEAGIDRAATEAAIQEITASAEVASQPTPTVTENEANLPAKNPTSISPPWIAAGGATGMALAFVTLELPEVAGISMLGAVAVGLILRAVRAIRKKSHLGFQLENLAVWFGMALGGVASGVFTPAMLSAVFTVWIVASVVGGLIVSYGSREEEPADDVPRIASGQ